MWRSCTAGAMLTVCLTLLATSRTPSVAAPPASRPATTRTAKSGGFEFAYQLRKPAAEIRMERAGDAVFIDPSPGDHIPGIGGMTIDRTAGDWPARLVVRLPYRMLESFSADDGRVSVQATLGQPAGHATLIATGAKPEGDWATKVRQRDGAIEVELPAAMLAPGTTRVTLSWIDAYRR